MKGLIILFLLILAACSNPVAYDDGVWSGPDYSPMKLYGEWFRYVRFTDGREYRMELAVTDSTWRVDIIDYAFAEGPLEVEGKRILVSNPGCGDAVGTYVYVFKSEFTQVDLQYEEDACDRKQWFGGLWWRESAAKYSEPQVLNGFAFSDGGLILQQ